MNILIPFCIGIVIGGITFSIIYNWRMNKPIRECNKKFRRYKEIPKITYVTRNF